ncbi:adenylate/guanylate cyclase domain-containing protein [Gilvimarinus polysaccharolyticus]|uniref:adenylate/guanylate cyclase domain-containing protein n=1 Tax=Gilvimarinus polysaccharolyticus TaxID=863921 RepID=UPI000A570F9F|nr:adenylate/guanylate cyclase domain-containing protein [Gilvimarinus polysaccharolyticus]
MSAQREIQAVMFADVSGSSRLYKKQGNTQAKDLIDQTLSMSRRVIERHAGVVVKNIGDEVMARFSSATDACQAALELQRQSRNLKLQALRIGIAYGATLLDSQGDVFGDVVNEAAEVSHIARARQIVISHAVIEQLSPLMAQQCDAFDHVVLKGAEQTCTVYRLHWEAPSVTHSATAVMDVRELHKELERHRLYLRAIERDSNYTPEQLPLTFGREHSRVHWPINSVRASREHGNIMFRRGKYILVDHSTNGTYMQNDDQAEIIYLRREEIPLTGSGRISFGLPLDAADSYVIEFSIGGGTNLQN